MRNAKLKEILVKLKNVYPVDLWIYNIAPGKCYCTEGIGTFKKLYGKYVSILEEKWAEIIQEEIHEKLIYIPSIDALKKWADSDESDDNRPIETFYEDNSEKNKIAEYNFMLLAFLDENDKIKDWKQFVSDPNFIKDIFTDKGIYSLTVSDEKEEIIRLGKPSLPLVTEKTAQKLYYHVDYDDKMELYNLVLKFNFTHFTAYMYYNAVPMHK